MRQHRKPCSECPFRRVHPSGWLGGNDPKGYAFLANTEFHMPCHKQMHKPLAEQPQCAGRLIMWANQARLPRDKNIPKLDKDVAQVFANIREFVKHHEIDITPAELITGVFE